MCYNCFPCILLRDCYCGYHYALPVLTGNKAIGLLYKSKKTILLTVKIGDVMKKLSFTLIIALLATVSTWAQTLFSYNGDKYQVIDESARTVKYMGPTDYVNVYERNIPETVVYNEKTYTVTTIGEFKWAILKISKVTVPATVTEFEAGALSGFSELKEINLLATTPATLSGTGWFKNNHPDLVVTIPPTAIRAYQKNSSWNAFDFLRSYFTANKLRCEVIVKEDLTVTIRGSEEGYQPTGVLNIPATVNYGDLTIIVSRIGNKAFIQCKLTQVNIPSSVREIGVEAFSTCGLSSVVLADGVETIEDSAFGYNSSLNQITLPNSLTNLGASAFCSCGLTQVDIPAGVTSIGEGVFYNCKKLTAINVNAANTAFCSENGVLFNKDKTVLIQYPNGKSGSDYTIPESVTTINGLSFAFNEKLTSVTIGSRVDSIGDVAFASCSGLTEINVLATTPPTLGQKPFNYVSTAIPVYVPAASLEAYKAAEGWKDFTKLQERMEFLVNKLKYKITDPVAKTVELFSYNYADLPTGVVDIPANVNYGSSTYSVTSMRENMFGYFFTEVTQINIPSSLVVIGKNDLGTSLKNLERINVDAANPAFCSENGILFNKDKTSLIKYPAKKPEISYAIPESVTKIETSAFDCNEIIKQVTIPGNVTSIGSMAFNFCSALEQVNIPERVNFIGNSAFSGSGITEINIPAVRETDIEPWAFAICNKLKKVSLGKGIKNIRMFVFAYCPALEEMTVHAVEPPTVEQDAFMDVSRDIPVYVPAESLEAYKAAAVWKEFTNLQAIPSGLDTPSMPESIRIYASPTTAVPQS